MRNISQIKELSENEFPTLPSITPEKVLDIFLLSPTPVFFPREFHEQRGLEGYSPWGHKESDTTERLTRTRAHAHTHTHL